MAKSLMHWLKSDVKLVSIQEVDELYRSNPFILTGYRDKTTFFGCLKSVLLLHNETINIWSHLLGFAFFVGIFLRDILFLIPSKESGVEVTQTDFFVLCTLIICYQACMILSSLYHTFTCHSQQWSENCLTLDLIGITMALLATYLSGIYYAFWCAPFWRDFYLTTVGGLFILATMAQFFPGFADEKNSHYRIGLFTFWAIYGIVPTVHWIFLNDANLYNPLVSAMLPRIVVMYMISGCAFFFYITKFPERVVPGIVDIIGHSHQWWHIFIFLALFFWHNTGMTFALFRLKHGCDSENITDEERNELILWPFK